MTFYRLRAEGTTAGFLAWSTGLLVESVAAIDAVSADWAAALTILWAGDGDDVDGVTALYDTATHLSSATTYQMGLDPFKAVAKAIEDLVLAGTGANTPLPAETAVCVSTRTAVPGPIGRGRMFLPPPITTTLTAQGLVANTPLGTIADAAQGALASLIAQGHQPCLYNVAQGIVREIVSIDVGNVPDSQRRRRDKAIELRTSRDL